MDFKIAYDLDGVLAEKPAPSTKKWGKMNGPERRARQMELIRHYESARPLLRATGKFAVITARKDTADVVAATNLWFSRNYGFVPPIFFLGAPRTVRNVVAFKSHVLKHFAIEKFYEDNMEVLKGVRGKYPECELFFVDTEQNIEPF